MEQKIAKCPKCESTNLTFSAQRDKFICRECGYSGEKIKQTSRLEEQRKRLMGMTLSSKTRREIDTALRRKEVR